MKATLRTRYGVTVKDEEKEWTFAVELLRGKRTAGGGTATGPGDGGGGDRGPRGRGLQMDGSATQGTSTSQRLVGQRCQSGITTPIGDDEISNFL